MTHQIAVLSGDGIGPEVMEAALKVLTVIQKKYNLNLILKEALKKLNSESEIKFLKSEFANLMIDLVVDSDESQFILDRLYEYRIKELAESGAEGIVVGATLKPENPHLKRTLELAKDNNLFILGPGVGAQGGTIDGFADMLEANGIDFKMVGPNIGRDTMFPKGSNSNDDDRSGAIEFFVKAAARRILKSR
jgi:orotidine-5'-phosphate decarboxylase